MLRPVRINRIAINCSAIPANLIESELFGYKKGSFTDAKTDKKGLLEQAQGGTIFLDEIGELEFTLQAKLLRVLENSVFRRVGGLKEMPLDARVIAASNRNLRDAGNIQEFRQDLYFRLSIIEIELPPLRQRGDDILLLANYFIKTLDHSRHKTKKRQLSPAAAEAFRNYEWRGNVRELRNAIERTLILEESEEITLKYLPTPLSRLNFNGNGQIFADADLQIQLPSDISLEEVQNLFIEQAIERSDGNITKAARILKISRDQLRYRLKKKGSEN